MWCRSCQQDVPGVASADDDGRICCARCSGVLSPDRDGESGEASETPIPSTASIRQRTMLSEPPPAELDDWELEDDLKAVQRVMRSLRAAGTNDPASFRIDAGHSSAESPHFPVPSVANNAPTPAPEKPKRRRRKRSFMSWSILSLGMMMFACGGVLLGWSVFAGRPDLWSLGLPLALGGQVALLFGLVFQMEGLWQSNRDTSSTLEEIDDQMHDLRHATTLLTTSHSNSARSFYAHMADGASPQMLLTDLKGQLDMLAVKMANERR